MSRQPSAFQYNVERLLMGRERAYIRQQRRAGQFAFIHINKCGGKSIEQALDLPIIHDTALQRIAKVGYRRWESMYTFSIVRHPFAKVASHYRYRVKTKQTGLGDGHLDLNQWVYEAYGKKNPRYYDKPLMFAPCSTWLCDADDHLLVDEVFYLEQLDAQWSQIQASTGVTTELPRINTTSEQRQDVSREFDATSLDILRSHFATDFQRFAFAQDSCQVIDASN